MEWINTPNKTVVFTNHGCFIVWCSAEHVTPPPCTSFDPPIVCKRGFDL